MNFVRGKVQLETIMRHTVHAENSLNGTMHPRRQLGAIHGHDVAAGHQRRISQKKFGCRIEVYFLRLAELPTGHSAETLAQFWFQGICRGR